MQHRSLPTPGVHAVVEAKHVAQVPEPTSPEGLLSACESLHAKPVQHRSKPAPAVHESPDSLHVSQLPVLGVPCVVSSHAKPVQHSPTAHVSADFLHVTHLLSTVLQDKPVQHSFSEHVIASSLHVHFSYFRLLYS